MPYRVYGLSVESALPLSCPRISVTPRAADVRLCLKPAGHFERARRLTGASSTPDAWFECRALETGATYLRWAGLFEFLVSADARRIDYRRLGKASPESLTTYLLGQVLSFSLLSRGCEPLHATAVTIDGGAVAFLGDCGYGKSTLGAAFVARGFPMLTDDLLALERRAGLWVAHAGPPRLKLFPSVARAVLGARDGTPVNPATAKLILTIGSLHAAGDVAPLRALYVLAGPARARAARRIRITPLAAQDAFLALVASTFNPIRADRARLKNQFSMTTRLVREVSVRQLSYPRRLSALDQVCDSIVADVTRQG